MRVALCVRNDGFVDLEVGRSYPVLDDQESEEMGCLRVIDESGEDYVYPAEFFTILHA